MVVDRLSRALCTDASSSTTHAGSGSPIGGAAATNRKERLDE